MESEQSFELFQINMNRNVNLFVQWIQGLWLYFDSNLGPFMSEFDVEWRSKTRTDSMNDLF